MMKGLVTPYTCLAEPEIDSEFPHFGAARGEKFGHRVDLADHRSTSLNSHAKGRPNGVHSLLRSGWAFFHCVGPVCYVFSVLIYTFHMVIMNTLALSVDIS